MKKFVCLLVALMLCLSCAAIAGATPSKTVSNMTTTATVTPVESFVLAIVTTDNQELLDIAAKEIEKLAAVGAEAYYGDLAAALKEKVGETLNVSEMHPVVASGYKAEMGDVTVKFAFATPYAVGDKVAVTIGDVTVNADGTQNVAWTAFDAAVVDAGVVEVTFDPATVTAIQEGTALLAVVSK